MKIKVHDSNHVESIQVMLSRDRTPIAFQNKLEELMAQKAFDTEEEAIKWIEKTPFKMEMYYEKGHGLFLVESEAIDSCDLVSPYTKEELVEQFTGPIDALAEAEGKTHDEIVEELAYRYDGYHFTWPSPDIFNPYSLLNALAYRKMDNY